MLTAIQYPDVLGVCQSTSMLQNREADLTRSHTWTQGDWRYGGCLHTISLSLLFPQAMRHHISTVMRIVNTFSTHVECAWALDTDRRASSGRHRPWNSIILSYVLSVRMSSAQTGWVVPLPMLRRLRLSGWPRGLPKEVKVGDE